MGIKNKLHIAFDDEMNKAFIEAWHKSKDGKAKNTEHHHYFEDDATLLNALSRHQNESFKKDIVILIKIWQVN